MKEKIQEKITILFTLVLFWNFFSVPLASAAGLQLGSYALGTMTSQQKEWMASKFSFISGDNSTPPFSGYGGVWTMYRDIYTTTGTVGGGYYDLKSWAESKSVNTEDVLLHAKVNYTSALATAWNQMDKFDIFEGAKGILTTTDEVSSVTDGITFSDRTSVAYAGNVTWQGTVYVGYEMPFDQVNIVVSNSGSGVASHWEYWTGSFWESLAVTGSITATGQIYFVPPSDWKRKIINGSKSKYFIRCRVSAVSYPITSSIKGDNWINDGVASHVRGWDPTSSSIVNSGELAYNPTPPVGSAARFRYQARIPMWASNYFVANPADFQSIDGISTRTWSAYLVQKIVSLANAGGYGGVMGDNGQRDVASDGIHSSNTDFADKTTETWSQVAVARYRDIVNGLHSALGNDFKVGINAKSPTLAMLGDWNLAEYANYVISADYPRDIVVADSFQHTNMVYDDYLTSGTKGLMLYADTTDTASYYVDYPNSTIKQNYNWDRGNRGPMYALTRHLIAANDNVYFGYFSRGGFYYSERDDVVLKDNSIVHLATDPVPELANVKRWGMYFPAMGVDFGVPDVMGHSGGVRDLAWKSHTEIGGTTDIWRRDYTNAVVLHRTATWSTNISERDSFISINMGNIYYPLTADGKTGAATSQIFLRAGEGAILMKAPIGTDAIAPAIPTGLSVQ